MVSIIICSRSEKVLSQVKNSVQETIGVPFEIIAIDNSGGRYGICEAYNIGAQQSKYDSLCFMHEDLKFHTLNWGSIVIDILSKPEVGVLGVAGGPYQPKAPAGWGTAGPYLGINVIHTSNNKTQHDYVNPLGQNLIKAATLDGLWLCCRKAVWEEFKFDSIAFPAFHFYDIDFCTRVATKYTNYITFEVLIEHFSHGTFDKLWMQQAINFYKQRKSYLPFGVTNPTRTEKRYLNLVAMQSFVLRIIAHELPKKDVLFCLKECLKMSLLNRDTLYLVRRYMAMK